MNCLRPELPCEARRGERSNCDCRWCVFNSRFNKDDEQHGYSEGNK